MEGHKIIKQKDFKLKSYPFLVGSKDGIQRTEPEISVQKENNLVTGIEVHCTCGRVINIECR